jgi:hypothetical protein
MLIRLNDTYQWRACVKSPVRHFGAHAAPAGIRPRRHPYT